MDRALILKAFGTAMRDSRKHSGLTQEELAIQTGLDRSYISLLERGDRAPSLITLFQIANALKVAPSTLCRRIEDDLKEQGHLK